MTLQVLAQHIYSTGFRTLCHLETLYADGLVIIWELLEELPVTIIPRKFSMEGISVNTGNAKSPVSGRGFDVLKSPVSGRGFDVLQKSG